MAVAPEPVAQSETTTVSLAQSDRSIARLPFIEGIRGYAALMIVLGHCARGSFQLLGDHSFFAASATDRVMWLAWPANQMVYLFLMVSGFSLFYSEDVRRLSGRGATSLSVFAQRRAWRILPTYYAAYGFGLAMLVAIPNHLIDGVPALGPEPVSLSGVLAHLGLVHNFERAWYYQGNGPLWSMAVEVQLYLLFPLLYWACKRCPALLVIGAAALADVAVHHGHESLLILGLLRWFGLGILVAAIYRAPWVARFPTWLMCSLGLGLVLIGYLHLGAIGGGLRQDAVWGGGYLLLLLAMTRAPAARANPMNVRWLRWVGLRSYSLYAFHFPVLWAIYAAIVALGVHRGTGRTVLLFIVGVGASIAVAQVMFRLVERPSLRRVRDVGR